MNHVNLQGCQQSVGVACCHQEDRANLLLDQLGLAEADQNRRFC